MQTDHEIYPVPLFPQLTVSDIEESTDWYRALGFDVVFSMPVRSSSKTPTDTNSRSPSRSIRM